ncbi:PLC-like phosphodiesterase [Obelidium mucronatum]|nr:PLC-like phosphodiesterase [Obelidium mucronatum]
MDTEATPVLLPTPPPRSPSPAPGLEVVALEQRLARGTAMLKYPNKAARRPEERIVRVVGGGQPSSTSAKYVLAKILVLLNCTGKTADVEERAFSIIYVAEGQIQNAQSRLIQWRQQRRNVPFGSLVSTCYSPTLLSVSIPPPTPLVMSPIPGSMNSWLEKLWSDADPNNVGKLGLDSVTALMGRLNLRLSKLEVKSALKNSGITKHSFLVFDDFERLYRTLRFRPEIGELFASLAKTSPSGLTFEEFEQFMIHIQKSTATRSRCLEIYNKYLGAQQASDALYSNGSSSILPLMDIDHFSAFLLSANNAIFRKQNAASVHHDMTHPLTDYLINSSHNTYLLGDQIAGECSIEGYIRALQHGCRCLELDCFDGPNGPTIYHKNSLTNRILFRDVVDAISRYAFVASQYPLILSLETHCSVDQQAAMARILVEVLGDALVQEPLIKRPQNSMQILPSPTDLMGRILIKGKTKPINPDLAKMVSSDEIDDESEDDVGVSAVVGSGVILNSPPGSASSATSSPPRAAYYNTVDVSPLLLDSCESGSVVDALKRTHAREEEAFVHRVSSSLTMGSSVAQGDIGGGGGSKRASLRKIASSNRLGDRAAIKKRYIVEKSLMDLVVYCKAVRFTGMDMLGSLRFDEMVSISESRFSAFLAKPGANGQNSTPPSPTLKTPLSTSPTTYNITFGTNFQQQQQQYVNSGVSEMVLQEQSSAVGIASNTWIIHHTKHLSRIYPSPLRISSSNPENPCLFWAAGVQMVALNYQTFDRGMQVNSAIFKGNGGCGYVLKSSSCGVSGQRRKWGWNWHDGGWRFGVSLEHSHDAESESVGSVGALKSKHVKEEKSMTLTVKVISGQQLPSTKEGGGVAGRLIHSPPWVEIEIVGVETDCARYKTRASSSGGQ